MTDVRDGDRSPSEWGEIYQVQRSRYEAFAVRLRLLLVELLRAEEVGVVQIDARAKEIHSFEEKIGRRPGKYPNPLADITDLVGIRVIVYYASDVKRVDTLIEREFAIDEGNSWRRLPEDDPDRFGYRSDHYVVSSSSSRRELTEWLPYDDIKAEIQVRTALQHAWAAIDHRLNYKRPSEIPVELKRQLFRISALLELADDQFEAVREGSERLSITYSQRISMGDLDLPIDRESVEAYLEISPQVRRWSEAAATAGFNMEAPPWAPDDDDQDFTGNLVWAIELSGLTSLAQLDSYLTGADSWGDEALAALRPAGVGPTWFASPAFIVASLLYIGGNLSDDEIASKVGGGGFYAKGIGDARKHIAPSDT
jgi:putative GTP pyrophosphokinase